VADVSKYRTSFVSSNLNDIRCTILQLAACLPLRSQSTVSSQSVRILEMRATQQVSLILINTSSSLHTSDITPPGPQATIQPTHKTKTLQPSSPVAVHSQSSLQPHHPNPHNQQQYPSRNTRPHPRAYPIALSRPSLKSSDIDPQRTHHAHLTSKPKS
jgi:hypothetical protein